MHFREGHERRARIRNLMDSALGIVTDVPIVPMDAISPQEIGDSLDIPRRTVYSRLQRALESVRGVLEADARTPGRPSASEEVVQ